MELPNKIDILEEAERLKKKSDDELFLELGLRIQDMQNPGGYQRSFAVKADFVHDAEVMGDESTLKKIGENFLHNMKKDLVNFICDEDNPDLNEVTKGKNIPEIVATLVAGALASLSPPAWTVVLATILARLMAKNGLSAFCEVMRDES